MPHRSRKLSVPNNISNDRIDGQLPFGILGLLAINCLAQCIQISLIQIIGVRKMGFEFVDPCMHATWDIFVFMSEVSAAS